MNNSVELDAAYSHYSPVDSRMFAFDMEFLKAECIDFAPLTKKRKAFSSS